MRSGAGCVTITSPGVGGRRRRPGPAIDLRQFGAANMADKTKVAEQYYAPPPELGKWEALRLFIYDGETGAVLGRTGSSWGESASFALLRVQLAATRGFPRGGWSGGLRRRQVRR